MTEEQNIEELPKDWKWVKLGEVAKKVSSKATPGDLPFAKFIGMDCIEPNNTAPTFLYDFKDFKSSGNLFSKDQVLYGRMRPYLNKVYRAEFDGVCSGEFIVLQSDNRLSAEFLKLILHSQTFVRYATSITTGDRPRLTYGEMSEYYIPLPPLPIQQAIVSKIEELFSELDKGIENLHLAQQQLKIYRQAVLKWAFEGKLSSTVMKYDTDDGHEVLMAAEPAMEYLAGKIHSPHTHHSADKGELPEGWKWVSIVDLVEKGKHSLKAGPFGSALKKEFYVERGYKIYGQEQVISGDAFYGNYYVNEEKYLELSSCKIKASDILISLVGTVGKVLVLPENCEPGVINPRLVKISLDTKKYSPKFFKYYFESAAVKEFYSGETRGTTMDVLNLGIIKTIPFPFCSLRQQQHVIEAIESRLSVADKMEESITQSLQQAEALRQSILKKAFEGRLV